MIPIGDYRKTAKSHDNWATPKVLYKAFMAKGYNDPCPLNCTHNGLEVEWFNHKLFVNPPFSQIEVWVHWCLKQHENNCKIWLLIPARTDTKYFHALLNTNPHIYFIKGRLDFNDCGIKAPFPTLLIYIDKNILPPTYNDGTLEEFIDLYLK